MLAGSEKMVFRGEDMPLIFGPKVPENISTSLLEPIRAIEMLSGDLRTAFFGNARNEIDSLHVLNEPTLPFPLVGRGTF
jgi:hypothetical protein